MANSEDYNAKLDAIKAIPNDLVQIPSLPVDVFLQETENLYHWSLRDAEKLIGVGITQDMIDDLPVRAGALRQAQSLWFKDRYSQEEAQKEWADKSPGAYELRDELLHDFRYAYREDAALLGRISEIADGSGHADMIQDLSNLATLGKANTGPLEAIGYDMSKLDIADQTAESMADILATANGDKAEQNETKLIRDKAYTLLKERVDEIREAGKYLFWKNKQRYKGYVSAYWKKNNRAKDSTDLQSAEV
ncbi:hypothetical protein [Saccharicrinis sp. FJH54]|uniref:hypothetical protein n=1 Tax=Saccharicrinis sp. FJH54 TaxID=3344665 RepID=UPI0035D4C832